VYILPFSRHFSPIFYLFPPFSYNCTQFHYINSIVLCIKIVFPFSKNFWKLSFYVILVASKYLIFGRFFATFRQIFIFFPFFTLFYYINSIVLCIKTVLHYLIYNFCFVNIYVYCLFMSFYWTQSICFSAVFFIFFCNFILQSSRECSTRFSTLFFHESMGP